MNHCFSNWGFKRAQNSGATHSTCAFSHELEWLNGRFQRNTFVVIFTVLTTLPKADSSFTRLSAHCNAPGCKETVGTATLIKCSGCALTAYCVSKITTIKKSGYLFKPRASNAKHPTNLCIKMLVLKIDVLIHLN